jgi:predicted transcriptional regulator
MKESPETLRKHARELKADIRRLQGNILTMIEEVERLEASAALMEKMEANHDRECEQAAMGVLRERKRRP